MAGIVVGVDGSDGSRRALDWALEEGAAHDLPVKVVLAWDSGVRDLFSGDPADAVDARERAAVELVGTMVAEAQDRRHGEKPVRTTAVAIQGDPRVILTTTAEGADQLVVASRGTTGAVSRLVLGSTATYVVHHSPCPVTVVPAAVEADR